MKILKSMKRIALAFSFAMLLSGVSYAGASGSIFVKNLGPLNSFTIDIANVNRTGGLIKSLVFDLSGTQCGGAGCIPGESLVFGVCKIRISYMIKLAMGFRHCLA